MPPAADWIRRLTDASTALRTPDPDDLVVETVIDDPAALDPTWWQPGDSADYDDDRCPNSGYLSGYGEVPRW